VELYSQKGVDPSRLYIKIASTWEGILACRQLQKEGIDCNMTLLFSFGQVGGRGLLGLLARKALPGGMESCGAAAVPCNYTLGAAYSMHVL
jgi:transaldolase